MTVIIQSRILFTLDPASEQLVKKGNTFVRKMKCFYFIRVLMSPEKFLQYFSDFVLHVCCMSVKRTLSVLLSVLSVFITAIFCLCLCGWMRGWGVVVLLF